MSTHAVSRVAAISGACAWLGLTALGCARDLDAWDTPVPPPHLLRVAATRPSLTREYALRPESHAELELGPRSRRIKGQVPLAAGRLWLDVHDLSATRALLTFDLAAIGIAGSQTLAPTQRTLTDQSLDWLQIGGARDGAAPEHRYARFTLLAVGSASSNDATDAPTVPASQPGAVARRVRLRAGGELELHGYRLPQAASLLMTFEWPDTSEPAGPPARIVLATAEPFAVDLIGHGVVPRDARGEVLAVSLAELRKLPAPPVQVGARWVAELVGERNGAQPPP